jgi:ArsR family transcriptional regulator, lead/cadmium/zinc/bismuth-responsive transcriptional repressor
VSICSDIQVSQTTASQTDVTPPSDQEACEAPHLDAGGTAARRQLLMSVRAVHALAETFRVLGDPTRVRILDALSRSELCVGDLALQLGVTESAVSHQLRLLRNIRIVRSRREGRMIFYALDDKHVLALFRQGLRHVQEEGRKAEH